MSLYRYIYCSACSIWILGYPQNENENPAMPGNDINISIVLFCRLRKSRYLEKKRSLKKKLSLWRWKRKSWKLRQNQRKRMTVELMAQLLHLPLSQEGKVSVYQPNNPYCLILGRTGWNIKVVFMYMYDIAIGTCSIYPTMEIQAR